MSAMEEVLAQQQQLLNQIEQVYTNFKKDGSDRKTSEYIRRRLENLDACWQEYQSNHIRLCSIEYARTHTYFTSKQFDTVKERYQKIRAVIQNHQPTEDRPSTPLLKPATPLATSSTVQQPSGQSLTSQGSNSKTDEMIRKQMSNFKAFEHTVSSINLDAVAEKWEFDHLLSMVSSRWAKIDTQHWDLDSELGDRNQEYHRLYLKYESTYNDAIKAINKKMSSISHREHTTPKIEIPTFSGSYHQWTSFKDLFTEAVHSNPSLSGAQKMQFLKSKVKGEAERLIQHLPISSDNYIISWDILSHRYDNKRMIFTSHINILLNIPISQQASINHIKRIHDTALETMNAIQNLGVDVTSWDPLIVHILCQKLDSDTFSEYNAAIKQPRELLELNEFLAFLEGKFTSMEASRRKQETNNQKSLSSNIHKPSESKQYHFKESYSNNKALLQSPSYRKLQNDRPNCPVCNDGHAIFYCKQFADFTPMKKKQCVTNLNYCKNCLHDHKGKECISKKRCFKCNEFHNTLLHESYSKELSKLGGNSTPSTQQNYIGYNQERENQGNTHVTQQNMVQETLLSTALLKVQKADGAYLTLRALIDQGSQMSLITENAAQQLGLQRSRCDGIITGIGQTENSCKGVMNLNCMSSSRIKLYQFNIDVFIMNNLTKYLPSYSFPKIACPFLEKIELADPEYNISRPIDILLGADVYSNILLPGMCRLSESLPLVQETRLGWILCGNMKTKLMCNVIQLHLDRFQQFRELEDVTEEKSLSSEDQECIQYYKATKENQEIYTTNERRKKQEDVHVVTKHEPSIITDLLSKYQSISKISRPSLVMEITTYKRKAKKHYLSLSEINLAKQRNIKQVQQEEVAKEIRDLKQEGKLNSKSKLLKLNPYLDENDILKVKGNVATKSQLRHCVTCKKQNPDCQQQVMGHVRVVRVKTKNGTLKRPITKLSKLPVNNEPSQIKQANTAGSGDSSTDKQSETRKVGTRYNITSVFIAIMLFFSIRTTSQCSLNVTQFRNNQHIYFDKLTNMQIIRDYWKLIIYYDLDPYWEGLTALNKSIMSLEQTCRTIKEQTHCDIILLQLRHGSNELDYNNHMLLSQHFAKQANRWRRGLIDGVGYIANGLFGVLDARFAEHYEKDIILLRKNQKHIVSFWQNQTSINVTHEQYVEIKFPGIS